jgi:hypothetical protein
MEKHLHGGDPIYSLALPSHPFTPTLTLNFPHAIPLLATLPVLLGLHSGLLAGSHTGNLFLPFCLAEILVLHLFLINLFQ